jgi:hypothetical protein
MKNLLVLIAIGAIAWFGYKRFQEGGAPQAIENPIYGEIRANASVQGRDIEMALFVRSSSELDCRSRARESWSESLKSCPSCTLQPVKCQENLPPRYARLFDDVPIPSAYLSATAGARGERDGRLVIYGLTDAEGIHVCEILRTQLQEKYKGTSRCVQPSGG